MLLTHKSERAPILVCDGFEVSGAVIPHEVDVLLHREGVELAVEQVVVVHVDDGAGGEGTGELEELSLVCYRKPVGHDHVGRRRVPAHSVVAIPVVFGQAGQAYTRRQRLVEQLDGQEGCVVRVPVGR